MSRPRAHRAIASGVWAAGVVLLVSLFIALPASADPYNRGRPGAGSRPPSPQPAPRVAPRAPRVPDAARQRQQREQAEAQRRQGGDAAEAEVTEADESTQDLGELLDQLLDGLEAEDLRGDIMEEWLDQADSDKTPEEAMRDAIDKVLGERGVEQDITDRAADQVSDEIWPDEPSDSQDSAEDRSVADTDPDESDDDGGVGGVFGDIFRAAEEQRQAATPEAADVAASAAGETETQPARPPLSDAGASGGEFVEDIFWSSMGEDTESEEDDKRWSRAARDAFAGPRQEPAWDSTPVATGTTRNTVDPGVGAVDISVIRADDGSVQIISRAGSGSEKPGEVLNVTTLRRDPGSEGFATWTEESTGSVRKNQIFSERRWIDFADQAMRSDNVDLGILRATPNQPAPAP